MPVGNHKHEYVKVCPPQLTHFRPLTLQQHWEVGTGATPFFRRENGEKEMLRTSILSC